MIPAWLARFRVTSDWASHLRRGSAGGVDFAAPVGTMILAPSDGYVDFVILSDGSSAIRSWRSDGSRTEFLHGRLVGGERQIRAGDVIGTSDGRKGTYGAGASTGPHIHVHDVTAKGVRVYPFSTITTGAPAGAGGGKQGADMPLDAGDKQIIKDAIYEFMRDTGKGVDWAFLKNPHTVDKQSVKDAIFEYDQDVKLSPGNRNRWQFEAEMLKAAASAVDLDALARKIVALLPAGVKAPTAAEVAKAVRSEFRADPLK